MSMTLEEASRILTYLKDKACSKAERVAISMAVSALRPVSREMVEKVWEKCQHSRVCGTCKVCVSGRYQQANFCAACGAPLTDEAVEMVLERLEALHDNRT